MLPALLLLHLASATPLDTLVRRADQYSKVSADIAQTITDVTALNTTLNGYGYDVSDIGSGLIGTYNGAQAVATDIQNTVNDAKASDPFTTTESQNLYLSLASLLEPTFELLDNFVAHCNTYTKVGITSIVISNLQSQRGLVQQESDALAAKVAAPYPKSISFGAGLILSKFDSALSIFQASSCPPPGSTAFPPSNGGGSTVTVTAPGSTVTAPGGTVTVPGGTITKTVTLAGATGTVTQTSTITITQGGGSGPTVTVTAPGGTVTLPGGTVTLPGGTITKTVTTGGVGGTVTITAPGGTITKTSTLTQAGTCSKKPTSTICFFWQPCWGKTKRDAMPTAMPEA